MGKTPKPLRILVHPALYEAAKVDLDAMAAQGHVIHTAAGEPCEAGLPAVWEYDLVLGPNCWRMDARLLKYLPVSIAEARKVKFPSAKKAKDDDETDR